MKKQDPKVIAKNYIEKLEKIIGKLEILIILKIGIGKIKKRLLLKRKNIIKNTKKK